MTIIPAFPIPEQSPRMPGRSALRLVLASCGLMALGACDTMSNNAFDWDLRNGPSGTADEARQATAARPVPDGNGVLSYPGYQMAQAGRNETVGAMAYRLNVAPADLAQANALQINDTLRQGELLVLPKRVAANPQPIIASTPTGGAVDISAIATSALDNVSTTPLPPVPAPPTAKTAAATSVAASTPGGGKQPERHTVKRGETAFIIARAYNVSAKSLAEWNGLNAEMAIREGQTLLIPVATAPAPKIASSTSTPGSGSTTPVPPSASKPLPDEKTDPSSKKASGTPASPDLGAQRTAASASKMTMPASGGIVKGYDKKSNQGINIGAAAGSPVKAAEGGTVAAITRDTDQVQIVVIRHAGSLMTVYAGVDQVKVKKGDTVSRGQQIGVVRSGSPSFLHFEVRKGVDSLDPMTYLK